MALTRTTLAAAVGVDDDQLVVASATGFTVGNPLHVDNEFVGKIREVLGTTIKVTLRGQNGTIQGAHSVGSPVVTGPAIDLPRSPATARPIVSYNAAGAIAIPEADDVLVKINKATAAAMTLANPSAGRDGQTLTIMAETAAAHTVTNTSGFNNAGGSGDVGTFGGAIGDNLVLVAVAGKWNVVSKTNVTIA